MKYDSDDALDRALFALALEEPPADLRASILTATVYRPAPAFSVWEVSALVAMVAAGLWLAVLVYLGGGALFVHSLEAIGSAFTRVFSNVANLAWAGAGLGTAVWLTLFMGSQPFALAGQRSGRRGSR